MLITWELELKTGFILLSSVKNGTAQSRRRAKISYEDNKYGIGVQERFRQITFLLNIVLKILELP
jgi:hypothetical protein